MARLVRKQDEDGSFDREFWRNVDPAVRVEQTWVLSSQLRKLKGLPGREPRLRKSVVRRAR
jgi:hypothetical protein